MYVWSCGNVCEQYLDKAKDGSCAIDTLFIYLFFIYRYMTIGLYGVMNPELKILVQVSVGRVVQ